MKSLPREVAPSMCPTDVQLLTDSLENAISLETLLTLIQLPSLRCCFSEQPKDSTAGCHNTHYETICIWEGGGGGGKGGKGVGEQRGRGGKGGKGGGGGTEGGGGQRGEGGNRGGEGNSEGRGKQRGGRGGDL